MKARKHNWIRREAASMRHRWKRPTGDLLEVKIQSLIGPLNLKFVFFPKKIWNPPQWLRCTCVVRNQTVPYFWSVRYEIGRFGTEATKNGSVQLVRPFWLRRSVLITVDCVVIRVEAAGPYSGTCGTKQFRTVTCVTTVQQKSRLHVWGQFCRPHMWGSLGSSRSIQAGVNSPYGWCQQAVQVCWSRFVSWEFSRDISLIL